jgi:restriction system protein
VRVVPRRKKRFFEELIELPWWASLVVAGIVFFAIRWLLPAFAGTNIVLRSLAVAIQPFAWFFTLLFLITAALAALRTYRRRELLDSQRGLETLRALSWQDFERLVGEAYRRRGYAIEEFGGSAPDGGVDLLLYSAGRKTVVQCKRWRTNQVPVSLVRELYGVMVAEKAERAIFVTTGTYTSEALAFATGKPLELVDGTALARLVEGILKPTPHGLKPTSQTPMPTVGCPKCGGEMVRRVAKRGANAGKAFWGCRRYPQCHGVRDSA